MKKILITGASGFIGSFFVEEALRQGWETYAGIRKSSSREYLQDPAIRFIDLNYSNKEKLQRQIREHVAANGQWDCVIHNAGVTKCLNPADFENVNYLQTRCFVEALQEAGAIPEKFILMSSLSARDSQTAYGRSKQKAEAFLQSQTNFPYIILRPTGVYGPREKDYFLMVKSVKSGFDFAAGMEPQQLTFIYVKDLVKAAFLALNAPLSNKIYNVADGDVHSDAEYTEIVKQCLGKKRVLRIKVPLPLLKTISVAAEAFSKITKQPCTLNRDKYKIMAQRDWTCDLRPLQEDLGFRADYDLRQGMQESIDWYRANGWI